MLLIKNTLICSILFLTPLYSFAGDSIRTICANEQGTIKYDKIEKITISAVWPQGGIPSASAMQVWFSGTAYGIYSDGVKNSDAEDSDGDGNKEPAITGGAGDGMQELAMAMYMGNKYVTACVSDGYLIAIETDATTKKDDINNITN